MKVEQIYSFLADVYGEVTGKTDVKPENLGNIVDVGKELTSEQYRDNYVKSLLNRIGRMVFVDRPYTGHAPDILRESWEWGSIMSKSRTKDFSATSNPAWALTAGESVDQYIYTPPTVQTTLFDTMVTWEIDCSFVNRQLKQSFNNAGEYDRFFGMLNSQVNNNQVQNIDELKMRCINNLVGHRLATNVAVIDVLGLYNTATGSSLTAAAAPYSKEFLRFLAYIVLLYKSRIEAKTANFSKNEAGYTTFTPDTYLHLVMLDVFSEAIKIYLQSDTYHDDMVKIGKYDSISCWQGTGQGAAYPLSQISAINIQVSGLSGSQAFVNRDNVIGIMFDRDACGIINEDRRTEVAYNARGEYWNNFFKIDTRLFNDPAENAIVFVLGTTNNPSIKLNKSELSMTVGGDTQTLTATTVPAGATVSWESQDEDVATVSDAGVVTAVGAGETVIAASIEVRGSTYTAQCDVTVTAENKSTKKSS